MEKCAHVTKLHLLINLLTKTSYFVCVVFDNLIVDYLSAFGHVSPTVHVSYFVVHAQRIDHITALMSLNGKANLIVQIFHSRLRQNHHRLGQNLGNAAHFGAHHLQATTGQSPGHRRIPDCVRSNLRDQISGT